MATITSDNLPQQIEGFFAIAQRLREDITQWNPTEEQKAQDAVGLWDRIESLGNLYKETYTIYKTSATLLEVEVDRKGAQIQREFKALKKMLCLKISGA